jgi:hypothetical protein
MIGLLLPVCRHVKLVTRFVNGGTAGDWRFNHHSGAQDFAHARGHGHAKLAMLARFKVNPIQVA